MRNDNYSHLQGPGVWGQASCLTFIQFVLFRQQRKIVQSKTNAPLCVEGMSEMKMKTKMIMTVPMPMKMTLGEVAGGLEGPCLQTVQG